MDNLNAIHKAREAFIVSENSERIGRALSHNIMITNSCLVMQSTTKELTIGDGVDQEKSWVLMVGRFLSSMKAYMFAVIHVMWP